MDQSNTMRHFLRAEFHRLTLRATVERSGTYVPDVGEAQRKAFHALLREALDDLATAYETCVEEEAHFEAIVELSQRITEEHSNILRGGHFRIGLAQKSLNLFLKYLWCARWIPMPPHCPFDALVISLLPPVQRILWTQLDDLDGYRRLVAAARETAVGKPIAIWELGEYARLVGGN